MKMMMTVMVCTVMINIYKYLSNPFSTPGLFVGIGSSPLIQPESQPLNQSFCVSAKVLPWLAAGRMGVEPNLASAFFSIPILISP